MNPACPGWTGTRQTNLTFKALTSPAECSPHRQTECYSNVLILEYYMETQTGGREDEWGGKELYPSWMDVIVRLNSLRCLQRNRDVQTRNSKQEEWMTKIKTPWSSRRKGRERGSEQWRGRESISLTWQRGEGERESTRRLVYSLKKSLHWFQPRQQNTYVNVESAKTVIIYINSINFQQLC